MDREDEGNTHEGGEITKEQRCRGILVGLAAGDKNGGPCRMALRLAESLWQRRDYVKEDVFQRYYKWWKGPPLDDEKAFDTGMTFENVLQLYERGTPISSAAEVVQHKFGSAGVNAAHRIAPLAMANFIRNEVLGAAVQQETELTHKHELSIEVSKATAFILRYLLEGNSWEEAKKRAESQCSKHPKMKESFLPVSSPKQLSAGGFAPEVLRAALYFMDTYDSFEETLKNALEFACIANYCPVLVGAFAGAKYGPDKISKDFLEHCENKLLLRVEKVATALSKDWKQ